MDYSDSNVEQLRYRRSACVHATADIDGYLYPCLEIRGRYGNSNRKLA